VTARWYLGGVAVAAAVGWLAAWCHASGWAPVGLLSLAAGVGLGLALWRLAAMLDVRGRNQLIAGTLLFALVTIFAEHAWLYRDFRRQWHEARTENPRVALFRPAEPWSPTEYFRHEVTAPRAVLWCVDAALIVTSALGTVLVRGRSSTKKFVVVDDANERPNSEPSTLNSQP
jgi:hypothetical protein